MPHLRPRATFPAAPSASADDPAAGAADQADAQGGGGDSSSALGRLIAYVPAEVIATYQGVQGFFTDDQAGGANVLAGLGLLLLVGTPIWVATATRKDGEAIVWHQVVISMSAFAIWLLGVGNPLGKVAIQPFVEWTPQIGSIAIIVGLFVILLMDRIAGTLAKRAAGQP